ncbi:MAG: hypothetical protein Q8O41_03575 [Candidatus Methanoperedens sp.]|nr:hypothetical protein [Candidatus Methanoperedens sp.]
MRVSIAYFLFWHLLTEEGTKAKDAEIFTHTYIINRMQFKKKQTLTALFKTMLHELMTGQRRVHELEFKQWEDFQYFVKGYQWSLYDYRENNRKGEKL